ncbi:MAG TPA: hypothetical protein VGM26_02765 [Rhizomicrobium sp.]|jgi:hypothetical protein
MGLVRITILCALFMIIPTLAYAEDLAPVALNSLSAPPANIATIKVFDQHGRLLGQAEKIQTDQSGKPLALSFRATNGSTINLSAAAVGFDGKVMVAEDQPQISALTQPQHTATAQ